MLIIGLNLKLFLNEELERLKKVVHQSLVLPVILSDINMKKKTELLLIKLDEFKIKEFDSKMLEAVLGIQNFCAEIEKE